LLPVNGSFSHPGHIIIKTTACGSCKDPGYLPGKHAKAWFAERSACLSKKMAIYIVNPPVFQAINPNNK
jgi:hypothetical protein